MATIEDLYRVPENGKAEIVNGELIRMSPTGFLPSRASGLIYNSLLSHEDKVESGYACSDNLGFLVRLPHRESFSPDAAWYTGDADTMKFVDGPPDFAVEVRSENDYGPQAERDIAAKRGDYFAAGTKVVWDVDLQGEEVIRKYSVADPDNPRVFRRDEIADAEPAVPGWRFPVENLFRRRKAIGKTQA